MNNSTLRRRIFKSLRTLFDKFMRPVDNTSVKVKRVETYQYKHQMLKNTNKAKAKLLS